MAPWSVSADEADWASLLVSMIDQQMDPVWDTADMEKNISGTYKRPMEQALRVHLLRVSWEGILIVTLRRAHPSRSGVPEQWPERLDEFRTAVSRLLSYLPACVTADHRLP